MKSPARLPSAKRGFSLVEILTVVSILAIMMGISVTAFNQIQASTALSTAAGRVIDMLNLARQQAVARNRSVEVRFYELPDSADASKRVWRGMQLFIVEDAATIPLDRPNYFPVQVKMSDSATYSSFLDGSRSDMIQGSGSASGVSLPGVGLDYNYRAFRFKPDGSTSLATSAFATLHPVNATPSADAPAQNWIAVQLDPLNGRIQIFRP